jgi:hypothetical protein
MRLGGLRQEPDGRAIAGSAEGELKPDPAASAADQERFSAETIQAGVEDNSVVRFGGCCLSNSVIQANSSKN